MPDPVGVKHDQGKPDPTYLSWPFVAGMAQVRAFGSKKYKRNNWLQGIGVNRNCAAALRHIFQFLWESTYDKESGLNHLLHAACSLEQAYMDLLQHPHLDDRMDRVKHDKKERKNENYSHISDSDCGAV